MTTPTGLSDSSNTDPSKLLFTLYEEYSLNSDRDLYTEGQGQGYGGTLALSRRLEAGSERLAGSGRRRSTVRVGILSSLRETHTEEAEGLQGARPRVPSSGGRGQARCPRHSP